MTYNGSGTFNRPWTWAGDAAAGTKILASRHDTHDAEMATALSNVICRDGQSSVIADIPWGSKKITNLAAGVAPTDAATVGQLGEIRNFSSAISLTGPTPEARITFTGADLSFGTRVAGTPAGSYNRFVWNDNGLMTGTDVATMTETGDMTLNGKLLAYGDPNFGLVKSGTFNTVQFAAPASLAWNTAESNWTLFGGGTFTAQANITSTGNITSAAGNFIGNTGGGVVLSPGAPGSCYLRPNGYASGVGQFTVDSAGSVNASGSIGCSALTATGILTSNGLTTSGIVNTGPLVVGGVAYFGDIGASTFHLARVSTTRSLQFGTGLLIKVVEGGTTIDCVSGGANCWQARTTDRAFIANVKGYQPGGGNWADSSDERIKTVAGEYESGLEQIRGLRPVVYRFKGNDTSDLPQNKQPELEPGAPPPEADPDEVAALPYYNSPHFDAAATGRQFVGLIAQEVEQVMPGMVAQRSGYIDGVEVSDLRDLDTSPLIFAVVNAIKELATRVEALEAA